MWLHVGRSKFKDLSKECHKGCHKRFKLFLGIRTDGIVKDTDKAVNVAILIWLREIGIGIRILQGLAIVVKTEVEERIHKIGYRRLENWRSQMRMTKDLQDAWSTSRKDGKVSRIVLAKVEQKFEGFGQGLGIDRSR